jgi:hypothetical protein
MKKAEEQETNRQGTSESLTMYDRYFTANNSRVTEIKRKFITTLSEVYSFHRNIIVFINIIPDRTNTSATSLYEFKFSVAVEMECLNPQPFANNSSHFLSSVDYYYYCYYYLFIFNCSWVNTPWQ